MGRQETRLVCLMPLYCPKCGDTLTETAGGGLECVRGRMLLSQELAQRLRECYVNQTRRPCDAVFTYRDQPHRIGGHWSCPGCGVAAREATRGDLRCPACSQSLVEFTHSLIELHPHFEGGSKWR